MFIHFYPLCKMGTISTETTENIYHLMLICDILYLLVSKYHQQNITISSDTISLGYLKIYQCFAMISPHNSNSTCA
jgi:hypothetical protein